MMILAMDLGQDKSVACLFDTSGRKKTSYETIRSTPQNVHDLLAKHSPDRLVIEIGPTAGWVHDVATSLGIEVQVANPNHEAWRWRGNRHKSDRKDALKLAQLSAMVQLPLVHMPSPERREYRQLIRFRQTHVRRVTQIKNSIRSNLTRQGIRHPGGKSGWSKKAVARLEELAVIDDSLWRTMLRIELEQLASAQAALDKVESALEQRAKIEPGVALLQTIPGVGPRLAEAIVAIIDDPHRFGSGKEVGSYIGLAPRRYQSGSMDRQGRISGQGDKLLRALLVQVAWLGRRHNPWMQEVYDRALRGSSNRKKIAIIALARRLLVRCWAMLRDGTPWRPHVTLRLAA